MAGDDGVDIDSRSCRRMKRRSKANNSRRANNSCRADRVIKKNVSAAPTTEVIAIDDDSDYAKDLEGSGIPGYVDYFDGLYDGNDVHNTNVDNSSGYGAEKCADDGNSEGSSDVSIDPDYKVFLDNAGGKSNAMVLCLGNVVIWYGYSEDDAESSFQEKTCNFRTVNTEAEVNINNADIPVHPMDNHCVETTSKRKGSNKQENGNGREVDDFDRDYDLFLSSMPVDATENNGCKLDACDPDYKLFLSSMEADTTSDRRERNSAKRKNKNGTEFYGFDRVNNLGLNAVEVDATSDRSGESKKVRYSQNEKNSKQEKNSAVKLGDSGSDESDSDVIILDFDPSFCGQRTPFVSSRAYELHVDDHKILNSGRKASSEFREELIEFLKKPFVKDEYLQLMEQVHCRKLVERDIDLRSGPKAFKTKIMGKSYTDLHQDVHSKIIEAKSDQLKVLNILRGFFFWLKNLSREGAFRPWKDQSILDIRPNM